MEGHTREHQSLVRARFTCAAAAQTEIKCSNPARAPFFNTKLRGISRMLATRWKSVLKNAAWLAAAPKARAPIESFRKARPAAVKGGGAATHES